MHNTSHIVLKQTNRTSVDKDCEEIKGDMSFTKKYIAFDVGQELI